MMILKHALRRAVRYFPDNTATIFDGRKKSYRELWMRARALSKALLGLGVRRGDRIAIYLLNSPQFLEVVYACFEIGAVIAPLNTRLAPDELATSSTTPTAWPSLPTSRSNRSRPHSNRGSRASITMSPSTAQAPSLITKR